MMNSNNSEKMRIQPEIKSVILKINYYYVWFKVVYIEMEIMNFNKRDFKDIILFWLNSIMKEI